MADQGPVEAFLEASGLPARDAWELPTSTKRFPDEAHYRIEIPSTEGPACLEAVLEESDRLGVPIHRVSQGSGIMMLTTAEIDELVRMGVDASVEISLFARPGADWDTGITVRSPGGAVMGSSARGQAQLVAALTDIRHAADRGIRSVLIADLGLLATFGEMRTAGLLPADMQAKVSVVFPVANAASAKVVAGLGADTINLPIDLGLAHIAAIRSAVDVPLDIYVEASDSMGGAIRLHELPEIIRIAAPVHVKFGLRNAVDLYPAGQHLASLAVAQSRERVRRALLGMEILARSGQAFERSQLGALGAALPVVGAAVGPGARDVSADAGGAG